ncbi:hypothetical protein Bca52824_042738 [Brassica carinata]|uniref:Uncharacterized protein n=1 Tax=Brassica carinata TaxID=52824 RepID=A0A8X7UZ35_BRACI|nr:hypothetical protein Bca52824_042738 [Brassica carinata]
MWFWKAWWGDVNNCVSRTSLFDGLDGLEEGRLKASSSYSHGTSERAMMKHWRVCRTEFNF